MDKETAWRSEFLYIFRVDVGESFEFGLIEIHEEETVDRSQLGHLVGELGVKVRNVIGRFLQNCLESAENFVQNLHSTYFE